MTDLRDNRSRTLVRSLLIGASAGVVGSMLNVLFRSRIETDARHRQQIWYRGYAAGVEDQLKPNSSPSVVPMRRRPPAS